MLTVHGRRADGSEFTFDVKCRIDTPIEIEYYRHGGILPYVLRLLLESSMPLIAHRGTSVADSQDRLTIDG